MYTLSHIKSILEVPTTSGEDKVVINSLAYDTRKIIDGNDVLFLCLKGSHRDGHDFLETAYKKGVRVALVSDDHLPSLPEMKYIKVPDVLKGLQKWAAHHRLNNENSLVVGITGSNAKTIIKEWLFHMCHPEISVIRSPKSYNSQIGVALSLLQMESNHEVTIIEAGISTSEEMSQIEKMIKPQVGIFTNIGAAHAGGFISIEEKVVEKALLFQDCPKIIVSSEQTLIFNHLLKKYGNEKIRSWGYKDEDNYRISNDDGEIHINWERGRMDIPVQNRDRYFIENLLHTVVAALEIGIDPTIILNKIPLLTSLDMRLEHIQGRNGSIIINDAYVADITSLKVALVHVNNLDHKGPLTLVISDIHGLKALDGDYEVIADLIRPLNPERLITIGKHSESIKVSCKHFHFPNTLDLMDRLDTFDWEDHLILLKGARKFQLDGLVSKLERSSHSATLEINIPALHHNITQIKAHLNPGVGFIPVLKASAYGAGIEKIAAAVASHKPEFIAVAYTDEAIKMRQYGIDQRIIVLNPDPERAELLFNYQLEPEVHNKEMLINYALKARSLMTSLNIHIKLDTGMHRMGFLEPDIEEVISLLVSYPQLHVATIFSHLSSSDEPEHDDYTRSQVNKFIDWSDRICKTLHYNPGLHILNSEGIWRFPEFQFDYVRAGITLYGISNTNQSLKKVHALYGRVLSVKNFPAGTEIGYGKSQTLKKDSSIAVINIGYADGLLRAGSNGVISVSVNGVSCSVVGRICMDVTMVDVSGCNSVNPGDIVEIFGHEKAIEILAEDLHTIPYEILCRISNRIVRKYIVD
ncbi:MAG: alanine racemase [Saprospiraceae bacterium]|nr:alanine racemase [Saprospiraceae bacterium]